MRVCDKSAFIFPFSWPFARNNGIFAFILGPVEENRTTFSNSMAQNAFLWPTSRFHAKISALLSPWSGTGLQTGAVRQPTQAC